MKSDCRLKMPIMQRFFLQRSCTFLIAVAVKDAIRAAVHDPKNHTEIKVSSAYQISRLIRNAFAHAPFHPIWSIDPDCRDRTFEVGDIVSLNTKGLNEQPFDWRHYGGPLAILRLSQFTRTIILKDTQLNYSEPIDPKEIYIQQGNLLLIKVDSLPPGAKRIL